MSRRVFIGTAAVLASIGGRPAAASAPSVTTTMLGDFELTIETLPAAPPPAGLDAAGTRLDAVVEGERGQYVTTAASESDRAAVQVGGRSAGQVTPWLRPVTEPEFHAAERAFRATPAGRADQERYRVYQPMPPSVVLAGDRRLISLGVFDRSTRTHRFLLHDPATGRLETPPERMFPVERAADCGVDNLEGCRKVLPEFDHWRFIVRRRDTELWRFVVSRARRSSGVNNSGIEFRDVYHRGRKLVNRLHTPILNVRYDDNDCDCGPAYRDWYGDEACFTATGRDVVGGLRLCAEPPVTIIDGCGVDQDAGGFRGLAVHATVDGLVFTTETKAAWYRYVSQYKLGADGSLLPRIGFGATANPCTCLPHIHHAYWRLDLSGAHGGARAWWRKDNGQVHHAITETKLVRGDLDDALHLDGTARYRLVPGPGDGHADDFGVADLWLLRARDEEIDDLRGFSADVDLARARLDDFLDGEPLPPGQLAVWYAAHWHHHGTCHSGLLGPDLLPYAEPAAR